MSSYRKVAPRREHRERGQLAKRKKIGFLQKHKDYTRRAKDYHKKKEYIRNLMEKAAFKNPDEFYFKMQNSQKKDGIWQDKGKSKTRTQKEVDGMQVQDINYYQSKRTSESRKIDRMQGQLHMLKDAEDDEISAKHTVFVDNDDEAENFEAEEYFDTPAPFLKRAFNRPTNQNLEEDEMIVNGADLTPQDLKKIERKKTKSYEELVARIGRQKKIDTTLHSLEMKKKLSKNGNVVKHTKKDGSAVFKWRQVRQR